MAPQLKCLYVVVVVETNNARKVVSIMCFGERRGPREDLEFQTTTRKRGCSDSLHSAPRPARRGSSTRRSRGSRTTRCRSTSLRCQSCGTGCGWSGWAWPSVTSPCWCLSSSRTGSTLTPGMAGIVLSNISSVPGLLVTYTTNILEMEITMQSVERVLKLEKPPSSRRRRSWSSPWSRPRTGDSGEDRAAEPPVPLP